MGGGCNVLLHSCVPSTYNQNRHGALEGACSCSVVACSGGCMGKVSEVFLLGESQLREALIRLLVSKGVVRSNPQSRGALRVARNILSRASTNGAAAVLWRLPEPNRDALCPGNPETASLRTWIGSLPGVVNTQMALRSNGRKCYHGPQQRSFGRVRLSVSGPIGSVWGSTR